MTESSVRKTDLQTQLKTSKDGIPSSYASKSSRHQYSQGVAIPTLMGRAHSDQLRTALKVFWVSKIQQPPCITYSQGGAKVQRTGPSPGKIELHLSNIYQNKRCGAYRHGLQMYNGQVSETSALKIKRTLSESNKASVAMLELFLLCMQGVCSWSSNSGLHSTSGNAGLVGWKYTKAMQQRVTG